MLHQGRLDLQLREPYSTMTQEIFSFRKQELPEKPWSSQPFGKLSKRGESNVPLFCDTFRQCTDNDDKPHSLSNEQCVPSEEWTVSQDDLTWHSQDDTVYHIPDSTPSYINTEQDIKSCSTAILNASMSTPQKDVVLDSELVSESIHNNHDNDQIINPEEIKVIDSETCENSVENSSCQNSYITASEHDETNRDDSYQHSQRLESLDVNDSVSQAILAINGKEKEEGIAEENVLVPNNSPSSNHASPPPSIAPVLCQEIRLSHLSTFRLTSSFSPLFSFNKPLSPLSASQIRYKLSNSKEILSCKLPPALQLNPMGDTFNYQIEHPCTLDLAVESDLEPPNKRVKITNVVCDDGGMDELRDCSEEKGDSKQAKSDNCQQASQTTIPNEQSITKDSLNDSFSNSDTSDIHPPKVIEQISAIETVEHALVPNCVSCQDECIENEVIEQAQSIHTVPTSTTSTITTTNSSSAFPMKNTSSIPTATSVVTTEDDDIDGGTLYSLPLTTLELLTSDIKSQAFRQAFPSWHQRAAYSRSFLDFQVEPARLNLSRPNLRLGLSKKEHCQSLHPSPFKHQ